MPRPPPADLVLGVYDGTHDAGAALVRGGRLVAACNEERFTRKKGAAGWPTRSIQACLEVAGVAPEQVEHVAFAGLVNPNPGLRMLRAAQTRWELDQGYFYTESNRLIDRVSQWLQFDSPFPGMRSHTSTVDSYAPALRRMLARQLRGELGPRAGFLSAGVVGTGLPRRRDRRDRITLHDHHRCHAAAAYYTSGRRDSLVIIADGVGDGLGLTVWRGTAGKVVLLGAMPYPDSYGLFYATITGFLGFRPFRHEGKITGLAARGDADAVPLPFPFEGPPEQRRFTQRFGPALRPWLEGLRGCSREDIAAWAQRGLEDELRGLTAYWVQRTGLGDLSLAGGVFANVQLNQRLAALDGVESLRVFPHMGDGGLAAGAALLAWADERQGAWVPPRLDHVFLGPSYDDRQLEDALVDSGLSWRRVQDIEGEIARRLAEGQIVCRFDGAMEYGPRALGNRSILAPAGDVGITDRLNEALSRSDFMPFAPAVLAEIADDWVTGLERVRESAYFMTVNVQARANFAEALPAAVHVDGSLRPQLVSAERTPSLHKVLRDFNRLTGLPGIINTSFNLHEEPIVCTPEEAVKTFASAGLDALALGPYLVTA
ncbi:MAG: carbamoyl transferase [Alphaproteobacteria bacterium]|nr:carbamoyl transferase [Alphaproteobacteria bacterium]